MTASANSRNQPIDVSASTPSSAKSRPVAKCVRVSRTSSHGPPVVAAASSPTPIATIATTSWRRRSAGRSSIACSPNPASTATASSNMKCIRWFSTSSSPGRCVTSHHRGGAWRAVARPSAPSTRNGACRRNAERFVRPMNASSSATTPA